MADTPQAKNDTIFRLGVVVLLLCTWGALQKYAPLVPKAATVMDDLHSLNKQAVELQSTATEIKGSLKNLEQKIKIFGDTAAADSVGDIQWMEMTPPEGMPAEEQPMYEWAKSYVQQERQRMSAEAKSGRRARRPDRAAVRQAVAAKMQSMGGILNWIRIAFWVWWIISML